MGGTDIPGGASGVNIKKTISPVKTWLVNTETGESVLPVPVQKAVVFMVENSPQLAMASGAAVVPSAVMAFSNGGSLMNLVNMLKDSVARMLGFLFPYGRKRRKQWGTVFEATTGQPIPFARVELMDINKGKVKEVKFTDKDGAYVILAEPGQYELKVLKEGYTVADPSNLTSQAIYANTYDQQPISISKAAVLTYNIPMEKTKELKPALLSKTGFKLLSRSLFWVAMAVNILIFISNPGLFNAIILLAYLALAALMHLYFGKTKFGRILDKAGHSLPFATVKLLNRDTQAMVSRTIADDQGRYFLVADPGRYTMQVAPIDGKAPVSRQLKLQEKTIINDDIRLKG